MPLVFSESSFYKLLSTLLSDVILSFTSQNGIFLHNLRQTGSHKALNKNTLCLKNIISPHKKHLQVLQRRYLNDHDLAIIHILNSPVISSDSLCLASCYYSHAWTMAQSHSSGLTSYLNTDQIIFNVSLKTTPQLCKWMKPHLRHAVRTLLSLSYFDYQGFSNMFSHYWNRSFSFPSACFDVMFFSISKRWRQQPVSFSVTIFFRFEVKNFFCFKRPLYVSLLYRNKYYFSNMCVCF